MSSSVPDLETRKEYDLAISHAGEDRGLARDIATQMTAHGYKVFLDEYERVALWGADLPAELGKIYMEGAQYCLILVSEYYAKKSWTHHELQFALSRALQERRPYILPLVLDGTRLEGLPPTVGCLDLRNSSVQEVCRLLYAKLGDPHHRLGETQAKLPDNAKSAIRDILAACYRRAVFTRSHAQLSYEAMFKSLAECREDLQRLIMYVEPLENRQLVAGIIAELDLIERIGSEPFTSNYSGTAGTIDGAKLRIISSLGTLANTIDTPLVLPSSITEELFWSEEDANKPPEGPGSFKG